MKTSEILSKAADIIATNGWVQEEYYLPIFERHTLRELRDPRKCEVCPRGAIAVAVGRHPLFIVDWPNHCLFESDADITAEEATDRDAIVGAERALANHLGVDDATGIEQWADDPDRALSEILAALREAAQAEAEAGR